jgi:hypothetical protein
VTPRAQNAVYTIAALVLIFVVAYCLITACDYFVSPAFQDVK